MIETDLNIPQGDLTIPPPYSIDIEVMFQIEMENKASLLIKGNLAEKTPALLKGISTYMGTEFPLNPEISLNEIGVNGDRDLYPYNVTAAVIVKPGARENNAPGKFPKYFGHGALRLRVEFHNAPYSGDTIFSRSNRVSSTLNLHYAKYQSIFEFLVAHCETMHGQKTEYVCKFYGNLPHPRGENVSAPLYHPTTFSGDLPRSQRVNETKLLGALNAFDKSANIPDSDLVFSFSDQHGDASYKVAVVYDNEHRTKTLCPMSAYRQHGCHDAEMFRFLGSKNIPWSQNDFHDKEIVITDNVEFAFWNRDLFLKAGKLLITFPEPYGRYDLLDLKPLNQARKVYSMVANFAAETMAEACSARLPLVQAINDALDDKSKFSVLMMSIAFEAIPDSITTTQQLFQFFDTHKPQIRETCIATSLDEFKTVCKNFEQKIQRKQDAENALYFVMDKTPEENSIPAAAAKTKSTKSQWIIRSVVDKGGHIEVIGQEKTGKTNFAVTVAYEIITANQQKTEGLIPGRYWTVTKNAANKTVYLDAELGEARFNVIRDRVKKAYLPKKSKEAAALDANFIYHDLFKDGIAYAKRENHQHILDLIVADEKVGTLGPVEMVILDTRRGFTRDQVGLEPQFSELIRNIRRLGCAVFVLHHMNEKNEAAGNYSVTTGKTGMIKMFRDYVSPEESKEMCNLTHPVKFKLSSYGAFRPSFDTNDFYAKCEDGKWTLMEMVEKPDGLNTKFRPAEFDKNAILKALVKEYRQIAKVTKSDIAEYLGTTDDTLAKRLK